MVVVHGIVRTRQPPAVRLRDVTLSVPRGGPVPFAVILLASVPALAQTPWYVSAGISGIEQTGMDQVGFNRDTVCYPTDACFTTGADVPGYRWRYGIEADIGQGIELAVGRELGGWRMEGALALHRHALEQRFLGVEYLDGAERRLGDGSVYSQSHSSIDRVSTGQLALNVFRDIPLRGVSAYMGVGAGAARVRVHDVRFASRYASAAGRSFDPPLSFYNGAQHVDLYDEAPAILVHMGAEIPLGDRLRVGARLTFSRVEGIADTGAYTHHPMHARDPDFMNENTFGASRRWAISVTLRYGRARSRPLR